MQERIEEVELEIRTLEECMSHYTWEDKEAEIELATLNEKRDSLLLKLTISKIRELPTNVQKQVLVEILPDNCIIGRYLPLKENHPLFHYVEDSTDSEYMVSIDEWEEIAEGVTDEERETISNLVTLGLTDLIISNNK